MAAFLAVLTALAPAIGEAGLDIIDFFVKDAIKNAAARAVYQGVLDAAKTGGAQSAQQQLSYADQVKQLQAQMAAKDAANAKS